MKKVKLKMPVSRADGFADYALSNSVNIILCWNVSDWFDSSLYIIASVDETKVNDFLASPWKQFIIN